MGVFWASALLYLGCCWNTQTAAFKFLFLAHCVAGGVVQYLLLRPYYQSIQAVVKQLLCGKNFHFWRTVSRWRGGAVPAVEALRLVCSGSI